MRPIRMVLANLRRAEEDLRSRWLRDTGEAGRPPRLHLYVLGGIVVIAAIVRFSTLGSRSYWVDEAVVVNLVQHGLWDMLGDLAGGAEGSPPLYYALAWFWAKIFGTGEFELRALSAILGTGAVVVAYIAGREILSSRAGLVTAGFFALSPFLVWHAQDARAHSLAVLLAGLSFVFFVRALREPRRGTLFWWALFSVAGLWSHYFVAFLVAAEAAWLLLAFPFRRVLVAVAGVGLTVLPALLIAQEQKTQSIDEGYSQRGALLNRLVEMPAQALVGEQPPLQRTMSVFAALLVLVALWSLVRKAAEAERRAALIPAIVAGVGLAIPVAGAIVGFDYMIARNVLPFWLPVLLVFAIGFGSVRAPRVVPAAAATLCLLWVAINAITADEPKFDREEWRGAAEALGAARGSRAIVVTPQPGRGPLRVYLGTRPVGERVRVREIAVVGLPGLYRRAGHDPVPPRPDSPPQAPPGFRRVAWREADHYTIVLFRAPAPMPVRRADLIAARLSSGRPAVLLQASGDKVS